MSMNDRHIVSSLYRLVTNEASRNEVNNIIDIEIEKLETIIKDCNEKLKVYENLKEEIFKKEV